jgi:secondary thiamine-phosphate synthase enzyme
VKTEELQVDTLGKLVVDVTDPVRSFSAQAGGDGLVHVFLPHATAGLALMETGSGSEADLEELVQRVFPRDERYRHQHGSIGHGGDHLLPVLISPSLALAVQGGQLVLGTWQSVVIIDPNQENNRRTVQLRFLEG